ncbi:hypothetical protein ABK040_011074 [Willaertia magna]
MKESINRSFNNLNINDIIGLCFDATCSLVLINKKDLTPFNRNIILWADHRAIEEAKEINETNHFVLKFVGNEISPEMQLPKILNLKRNGLDITKYLFFDLSDYLTCQCVNNFKIRSINTTTCKWTFVDKQTLKDLNKEEMEESNWNSNFFKTIQLSELLTPNNLIGENILPLTLQENNLKLTKEKSLELGLHENIILSIPIIDAHAGGIAMLGCALNRFKKEETVEDILNETIVIIAGTSACHLTVSKEPRFIKGIWGPYHHAMIPNMYLNEGGQSYVGKLLDDLIESHSYYILQKDKKDKKIILQEIENYLQNYLQNNNQKEQENYFVDYLTKNLHILDYFNGNRSPLANYELLGMIIGLSGHYISSLESLSLLYLSAIQSIAYGSKFIIEEMNKNGYNIKRIMMCGGLSNNKLFVQQFANICDCNIYRSEQDAMLLGDAVLASVSSKVYSDLFEATNNMCHLKDELTVCVQKETLEYHQRKYKVYKEMYNDQMKYKNIMTG